MVIFVLKNKITRCKFHIDVKRLSLIETEEETAKRKKKCNENLGEQNVRNL